VPSVRSCRRAERGQALLEFALVAPLVLFFLLAIVDFGIALDRHIVLDHAARESARFASVSGHALSTGVPATCADIKAEAVAQAQGIVAPGQVGVTYEDMDGNGTIGAGDNVTVTLNYTYDFVTGFASLFGTSIGSIEMHASASARVERGSSCT
jgi:Flp pilus assembly protein TadG